MRFLINYIRSCFCQHDWEMIFDIKDFEVRDIIIGTQDIYDIKTYRCKKCGYSKKYKSN